jgi:hypothetical protein
MRYVLAPPWPLGPRRYLGYSSSMREDTDLSLAEAVFFGAPIVLPNEFLHEDEISVDTISIIVLKSLDASDFLCPDTILAASWQASS